MTDPLLRFDRVSKAYASFASGSRFALRDVSFAIDTGRTVAIIGRSGSGKSTLLHLAAGLDRPSSGAVLVGGRDLAEMSDAELTGIRRNTVGLVFQFFHLLKHLTVFDNVVLPEMIAGSRPAEYRGRAMALLDRVGLADRAADRPDKLSGGEMQRIAICRALLRQPRLLLADEPTGNLDDANSGIVMDLMLSMAAEEDATVVFVTHSGELAERADTTWTLHSGELDMPH